MTRTQNPKNYIGGRNRKLSPEAEKKIITLVLEGYSPIDIAKAVGMSTAGIYKMLKRNDIPPQTNRGRKRKEKTLKTMSGTHALFNDYFIQANSGDNAPEWHKILNK